MDFKRGALVTVFLGLTACGSGEPEALPDITKWVQADANLVQVLTSESAECLFWPQDQQLWGQIALGRAAFRSPYLLGGQAARRGFSCNTCHTNGAVNEHFFIEGMSAGAGTADVTNFHFSETLGDDIFNPKPIPSLVTLATSENEQEQAAREAFILRLIEQEFGGASPSASIKEALIIYVEALDNKACANEVVFSGVAMHKHRIEIIDQMFTLLAETENLETKAFIVAALRTELGRLHERFPKNKALRRSLKKLSRALASNNIDKAAQDWVNLKPRLMRQYEKSLFHPKFVESYIK